MTKIKKIAIIFVVSCITIIIFAMVIFSKSSLVVKNRHFIISNEYKEYFLYPHGPKDSNGLTLNDERLDKGKSVENNSQATYFLFLPDKSKANGQAIIICPGGGYRYLANYSEGFDVANWLKDNGIASIVLMYRMPNQKHPNIPLEDAHEAIKLVRNNAKKWSINPNKVGFMGFSAGGHLAATVSNNYDNLTKPNFTILFYSLTSMNNKYTHAESKINLLGNINSPLSDFYSNELRVSRGTPPTFIAYAKDDGIIIEKNLISYYKVLVKNKVPTVRYAYPTGGHGWGWDTKYKYHKQNCDNLLKWLRALQ